MSAYRVHVQLVNADGTRWSRRRLQADALPVLLARLADAGYTSQYHITPAVKAQRGAVGLDLRARDADSGRAAVRIARMVGAALSTRPAIVTMTAAAQRLGL